MPRTRPVPVVAGMCLLQIERAGALVKRDPVYWTREYHTSDGVAQVGRGIAWETHHDALPRCVSSGLHQVSRIQGLPGQGAHRRLQERRTAAGRL